jgi:selenocysteine lyase/cysteine desulfurase
VLADFWGLDAPERICFTCNTTYALNFALKGLLRPGDHVLISELEHNAVRRPLLALQRTRGITLDTFPVLGKTESELLCGIERAIRPSTAALVCTQACNICSITLPLASIGALCHKYGLLFLVDAAQSAGHLPIDMDGMGISALAAPAHKALFGIQGAGVLALGKGISPATLIEGGSGSDSLLGDMPRDTPERFEAGTLPTPAIVALCEGVRFIRELGLPTIQAHTKQLFRLARERLESIPDLTLYQSDAEGAVLLFSHRTIPPTVLAEALAKEGVCVRAGYHCAPLAHAAIGTPEGGALRISFSPFNTASDLDALWRALRNR